MKIEYATKPDPQEPWRYVCAGCKSQVYRYKKRSDFICRECGNTYDTVDELHDKKLDN